MRPAANVSLDIFYNTGGRPTGGWGARPIIFALDDSLLHLFLMTQKCSLHKDCEGGVEVESDVLGVKYMVSEVDHVIKGELLEAVAGRPHVYRNTTKKFCAPTSILCAPKDIGAVTRETFIPRHLLPAGLSCVDDLGTCAVTST